MEATWPLTNNVGLPVRTTLLQNVLFVLICNI